MQNVKMVSVSVCVCACACVYLFPCVYDVPNIKLVFLAFMPYEPRSAKCKYAICICVYMCLCIYVFLCMVCHL